jgi:hypothetical protein
MPAPDLVIGSGIQTPGLRGMCADMRNLMAFDLRGPDVPVRVRRIGLNAEQTSACADKKGNAIAVSHAATASDQRFEGLHIDL